MEILVLGCGEAFDERLPNTSLLVDCGEILLLDCGYSVPPQVWAAVPDPNRIDAVYISHAHADHYFGLPALLTRMWEDGRTKPLMLVTQAGVLELIPPLMEMGYRGLPARFRYPIEHRAAEAGGSLAVGRARLSFAETRHSAPNLAVRIESGDRVLCYSGDGNFTDTSRRLFSGADLLIHEAYSFDQSPVHAEIMSLATMAQQENVRRLGLVHVARNVRRNDDRLIDVVQEGGDAVLLPEPGSRYTV